MKANQTLEGRIHEACSLADDGDLLAAEALLEQVMLDARRAGNASAQAVALYHLAGCRFDRGNLRCAAVMIAEAVALLPKLADLGLRKAVRAEAKMIRAELR